MMEIQADSLAPLGAIWCTTFDCSQLPTHMLVTYRDQLDFMPSDEWRDGPAVAVEVLSYPSDEYIRWYKGITRVYIGNPANRDTSTHGYQPAGVDRRMMTSMSHEVDDMASVAIREPPSSPSQMAAVLKKVQTIIRRCMVSIGGTLGCTPSQYDIQVTFPVQSSRRRPREHILDRGVCGVKRGARRHPGREAGTGRPPVPPAPQRQEHVDPGPAVVERGEGYGSSQQYVDLFDSPHLDMPSYNLGLTPDSQSLPSGSGTSQMPLASDLGCAAFQSLHSLAYGFSRFRAPPLPGTAGSSTPHQPISQASSSDKEEGQDALGHGHRVGKKTVRFTPSDWP
ncbi:hypothetical protein M9H77_21392 [Catharanthus roseus]|uniref:Uncharacterized protein n=1 Tax=Catharanthus roseus TaxID=4058 RepID=A0ACC0API4_CATRO|nr:hypothetical protein M9H77_21392 [Catharanthus roseus]